MSLALGGCTPQDAQRDQDSQESDLPQRARGDDEDAGVSSDGEVDSETSDVEPNTEPTIDAERDAAVISETVADAATFDTPLDAEMPDADISDPMTPDADMPDASLGLPGDSCDENADCEGGVDAYCYRDICLEPYPVAPPRSPHSCATPFSVNMTGTHTVTGERASRVFKAIGCGDFDLSDEGVERETERGYEVIFELNLPASSIVTISSSVGSGEIDLPSTLSLYNACDATLAAAQCDFTSLSGLTFGGGSVTLSNDIRVTTNEARRVYAVVDLIHGAMLRDFAQRDLQLRDLVFELSYQIR